MKVASMKKALYRGLIPYWVVSGEGLKHEVPAVRCVKEQDGWRYASGRMEKHMVNSCSLTGGTTMESVGEDTMLIPQAHAGALSPGVWYRRKASTVNAEEGMLDVSTAGLVNSGMPVFVTDSLLEFTKSDEFMGLGHEQPPLLSKSGGN